MWFLAPDGCVFLNSPGLLATLGTEGGCLSRMNFQKPRKKKRCGLLRETPEPPASGIGLCCVPTLRPLGLLMSKFLNGPCSHLPAQVSSMKQTGHARGVLGSPSGPPEPVTYLV